MVRHESRVPASPAIVTLTTDFGVGSSYIGSMKGTLLSVNPAATIVDLCHAVPPQNVRAAALILADTAPCFPPQSLHVAVIDPGVGTERAILYAEIGQQRFICPDNGLIDRLAASQKPSKIIHIINERYFRLPVASTFHGRDIMAPAAGYLSLGLSPEQLGPVAQEFVTLDWLGAEKMADRIQGEIVAIDSFGNLVTNVTREMLAGVPTDDSVTVRCDEHETQGIFTAYAQQPAMTLIALIGSNDALELAIVNDSAAIMLGVKVGTPVEVLW